MKMKTNSYLSGLDGVRGIMALAVAFSHSFGHFTGWRSNIYIFNNASYAVEVFFILSAIVLFHSYGIKIKNGDLSVYHFFLKRFFRIYPLHWACLILIFIVFWGAIPQWINFNLSTDFLSDITLTSSLIDLEFTNTLNQPAWSISVEMWAGGLILIAFLRSKIIFYILFLFSVIALVFYNANNHGGPGQFGYYISSGVVRCIYAMGCGLIIWNILNVIKIKQSLINLIVNTSMFVTLMIVWNLKLTNGFYLFAVPLTALGLTLLSRSNGSFLSFFNHRLMNLLGKYSFTLYLLHTPVIYLLLYFKTNNTTLNILLSFGAVAFTLLISPFIYNKIENHFNSKGKTINVK